MKLIKRKKYGGSLGGDIGIFIFLLLVGLFMMFPIYLSVIQALKPVEELFIFPPKLYILRPTTQNFTSLLRVAGNLWVPFSRYVFNSVFVSVVVTVAHILVATSAAYCLAKVKFPGVKILNSIIITALLFNSSVLYIMQYMVMGTLGMINTYFAIILPYIATPMGLFLMRQFMGQVHDAIIESAKLDGAGHIRICWQIVVPNVKPALLTMIMFAFQGAWQITGYAFIYNEALKTIPTIMQQISASGIARAGVSAATVVVLMIPTMLVFLFLQSNIHETMAHSGIKE